MPRILSDFGAATNALIAELPITTRMFECFMNVFPAAVIQATSAVFLLMLLFVSCTTTLFRVLRGVKPSKYMKLLFHILGRHCLAMVVMSEQAFFRQK
jgi:hypothetical protein